MKEFLFIAVGFLIGVIFAKYWLGRKQILKRVQDDSRELNEVNQQRMEERQRQMEKILSSFGAEDEITNDKVEKMLGVSDATAERYLDELEQQGKLRQIGKVGKYVTYRKA